MENNLKGICFSVIMPAYNAEKYIEAAIQSVQAQTYNNWELIIVNDGSLDKTQEIIEKFANSDKRIKVINQYNKGLGAARNAAMNFSSGEWICFLDADDLWRKNKLSTQYQFITQHQDIDVVFSNGYTISANNPIKLFYHFRVADGSYSAAEMYKLLYSGNYIPILSACVKSDINKKVNGQDEKTKGSEDWDFWIRLALAGAKFYGLNDRLFLYRLHAQSMSAQLLNQRFSSAMVLIKHYNPQKFSISEQKRFESGLSILVRDLRKSNFQTELVELTKFAKTKSLNPKINYFSLSNFIRFSTRLKSFTKKNITIIIRYLLFRPYQKFLKHAHNLIIQYTRWHLGIRLETYGDFFVSRKARIIAYGKNSKLITYGLYLSDYSQILLSGSNTYIFTGNELFINQFCIFNIWEGRLIIGNNVRFNNYCSINCMERIEIGDNTWFGEGVKIYDHNHKYSDKEKPFVMQGMKTGPIHIGENCWIGSNTVILQNVKIGDNCVIGANNLIYKSVPDNTIIKAQSTNLIEKI